MKILIAICFVVFFGWLSSFKNSDQITAANSLMLVSDSIDFQEEVKPIMIKNCSPCHFTGGKMYDRLPFDQDTTIINHEAGILRRIKGDENTIIKNFIQQNKNGSTK